MRSGPGGKDEQLLVAVLQLKRVAGEVGDLIPVSAMMVLPVAARRLRTVSRCAGSSIISSPTRAKLRSDAQHDVGVINRAAVIAAALEGDRFIIEVGTEFLQQLAIRPAGERDVGDAIFMIEDQAAGAFQVKPAFFIG